jgi:hypothetical protein
MSCRREYRPRGAKDKALALRIEQVGDVSLPSPPPPRSRGRGRGAGAGRGSKAGNQRKEAAPQAPEQGLAQAKGKGGGRKGRKRERSRPSALEEDEENVEVLVKMANTNVTQCKRGVVEAVVAEVGGAAEESVSRAKKASPLLPNREKFAPGGPEINRQQQAILKPAVDHIVVSLSPRVDAKLEAPHVSAACSHSKVLQSMDREECSVDPRSMDEDDPETVNLERESPQRDHSEVLSEHGSNVAASLAKQLDFGGVFPGQRSLVRSLQLVEGLDQTFLLVLHTGGVSVWRITAGMELVKIHSSYVFRDCFEGDVYTGMAHWFEEEGELHIVVVGARGTKSFIRTMRVAAGVGASQHHDNFVIKKTLPTKLRADEVLKPLVCPWDDGGCVRGVLMATKDVVKRIIINHEDSKPFRSTELREESDESRDSDHQDRNAEVVSLRQIPQHNHLSLVIRADGSAQLWDVAQKILLVDLPTSSLSCSAVVAPCSLVSQRAIRTRPPAKFSSLIHAIPLQEEVPASLIHDAMRRGECENLEGVGSAPMGTPSTEIESLVRLCLILSLKDGMCHSDIICSAAYSDGHEDPFLEQTVFDDFGDVDSLETCKGSCFILLAKARGEIEVWNPFNHETHTMVEQNPDQMDQVEDELRVSPCYCHSKKILATAIGSQVSLYQVSLHEPS